MNKSELTMGQMEMGHYIWMSQWVTSQNFWLIDQSKKYFFIVTNANYRLKDNFISFLRKSWIQKFEFWRKQLIFGSNKNNMKSN